MYRTSIKSSNILVINANSDSLFSPDARSKNFLSEFPTDEEVVVDHA